MQAVESKKKAKKKRRSTYMADSAPPSDFQSSTNLTSTRRRRGYQLNFMNIQQRTSQRTTKSTFKPGSKAKPNESKEDANESTQVKGGSETNYDLCQICGDGGDLLCCDNCPCAFHFSCVNPPIDPENLPGGDWFCKDCSYLLKLEKSPNTGTGTTRKSRQSGSTSAGQNFSRLNNNLFFEINSNSNTSAKALNAIAKRTVYNDRERDKEAKSTDFQDILKTPENSLFRYTVKEKIDNARKRKTRVCAICGTNEENLLSCYCCRKHYHVYCLDTMPLYAGQHWICPDHEGRQKFMHLFEKRNLQLERKEIVDDSKAMSTVLTLRFDGRCLPSILISSEEEEEESQDVQVNPMKKYGRKDEANELDNEEEENERDVRAGREVKAKRGEQDSEPQRWTEGNHLNKENLSDKVPAQKSEYEYPNWLPFQVRYPFLGQNQFHMNLQDPAPAPAPQEPSLFMSNMDGLQEMPFGFRPFIRDPFFDWMLTKVQEEQKLLQYQCYQLFLYHHYKGQDNTCLSNSRNSTLEKFQSLQDGHIVPNWPSLFPALTQYQLAYQLISELASELRISGISEKVSCVSPDFLASLKDMSPEFFQLLGWQRLEQIFLFIQLQRTNPIRAQYDAISMSQSDPHRPADEKNASSQQLQLPEFMFKQESVCPIQLTDQPDLAEENSDKKETQETYLEDSCVDTNFHDISQTQMPSSMKQPSLRDHHGSLHLNFLNSTPESPPTSSILPSPDPASSQQPASSGAPSFLPSPVDHVSTTSSSSHASVSPAPPFTKSLSTSAPSVNAAECSDAPDVDSVSTGTTRRSYKRAYPSSVSISEAEFFSRSITSSVDSNHSKKHCSL